MAAFSVAGCVLADDHVRTELKAICTQPVPMPFERMGAATYVATMDIEGVGRTVEEDAFAALDELELEAVSGIDSVGFADTLTMDLVVPDGALPDVRIAEVTEPAPVNPLTAVGDRTINLVDYLTRDETILMRVEVLGDAGVDQFAASLSACLEVRGVDVE